MTTAQRPTFTGPNRTGQTQYNFQKSIGRRILRVARIEDVTARYRRIVLTGDDLASGFPFCQFAPTDHVKLFFPNPDTGEFVVPEITAEGPKLPEGASAPISRDYSVRAYDPQAFELVIDFVLHGHGVAAQWARNAGVGDELAVLGPRANVRLPEDYPHYLAAGDESALPAISRLIEEAPAGSRVTAVIEVAGAAEEQLIVPKSGARAEIRWVHRDTDRVGTGHASALETALRQVRLDPDERVFAFAAGEVTAMRPIRRYLRHEVGLPKDQVDVDGYWKKGLANLDHHDVDLSTDDD